jgi:aryl carrier-like protein
VPPRTSLLEEKVARALGSTPEEVDLTEPLTDVGLDSLIAVKSRNWVEGELHVTLPIAGLLQGPPVDRLADLLLEQLLKADAPGPVDVDINVDASAEQADPRRGNACARDTRTQRAGP